MKAKHPLNNYEQIINLPKTLNIILLAVIISGISILGVLLYVKATFLSTAALIIFSVLLRYANNHGYHKASGFGIFLLLSSVITYNLILYNGLYSVSILAFPAVIVFSSLLLGHKFVAPITITVLAILSVVHQLSIKGIITPYNGLITSTDQTFWTLVLTIISSGFLVYIIMTIINENTEKILQSEKRRNRSLPRK